MLAEADVTGDGEVRAVVIGIGCNVSWAGYPDDLEAIATACDREAGRPVDRWALLDAFLAALTERLDGLDAVAGDYRARLATIGRTVRVELAAATIEGVATDVDGRGRLVVQPDVGPSVVVAAGDVVHLRGVKDPGSTRPA